MIEINKKVISTLNKVEGFENITLNNCKIKRLGGMTNLVHLVETKKTNLIVRIPGKGTEEYINREIEYKNASAAWRAGGGHHGAQHTAVSTRRGQGGG